MTPIFLSICIKKLRITFQEEIPLLIKEQFERQIPKVKEDIRRLQGAISYDMILQLKAARPCRSYDRDFSSL